MMVNAIEFLRLWTRDKMLREHESSRKRRVERSKYFEIMRQIREAERKAGL